MEEGGGGGGLIVSAALNPLALDFWAAILDFWQPSWIFWQPSWNFFTSEKGLICHPISDKTVGMNSLVNTPI